MAGAERQDGSFERDALPPPPAGCGVAAGALDLWQCWLRSATGTSMYFSEYASGQAILNDVATRLDNGRALTCAFLDAGGGAPLIASHEYTVVGVNRDAVGNVTSVRLRNPHGPSGDDAAVTVTGAQLAARVGWIAWGSVA